MDKISFLHPQFFWLFLAIPLLLVWYYFTYKKSNATLKMSSAQAFLQNAATTNRIKALLFGLRMLAFSAIIIALARPRTEDFSTKTKTTRGIDIVMTIDVSSSMLAKDLRPNRLEALKKVAKSFIQERINDRVGLVVYAGESYTKTPVTSDKTMIVNALQSISYDDSVIEDGTGIGVGLATAINRLKESKAKSRVIILLTDGVNNAGTIDPRMAADFAKQYGIKVYTIGIGTNGMADFPYAKSQNGELLFKKMPVQIDEKLMQEIAKITDGKYFRATSNQKLATIYKEIDKLETTEVKEKKIYNYEENFKPFLLLALLLLLVDWILKNTILRGFI